MFRQNECVDFNLLLGVNIELVTVSPSCCKLQVHVYTLYHILIIIL